MATNYEELEQLSFAELLDGQIQPIEADNIPPVEDKERASTFIRLVATRRAKMAEIAKRRDDEVSKINDVYNHQIEGLDRATKYFTVQLENYLREINRQSKGNIKSCPLSYGTISLRKNPDKIEINPEFNPEENPDSPFVKEKKTYSVDKTEIKTHLKKTGELPDWAKLVDGETVFKLEVN